MDGLPRECLPPYLVAASRTRLSLLLFVIRATTALFGDVALESQLRGSRC